MTTIQVSRITLSLLKELKGTLGSTYDEIIHQLLRKHLKVPESLAGKFPSLKENRT